MAEFYKLVYADDVPLQKRKHEHTVGRYPDWLSAETARESKPVADLLEVARRVVPFAVMPERA